MVIFIIVMFLLFHLYILLSGEYTDIKENWNKYKCNPLMMPLAGQFGYDTGKNFTQCIQSVQSTVASQVLQPVNHNIQSLGAVAGNLSGGLNSGRSFITTLRDSAMSIFSTIGSIFSNILIQFHLIMLKLKDTIMKIAAMMFTTLYMMDGSIKTVTSVWAGPPGAIVRSLSKWKMPGGCFHEDTELTLKNGSKKKIKDIVLGDVLINNSVVYSVMQIKNNINDNEYLSDIYEIQYDNKKILVSGSHLIKLKDSDEWIQVYKHKMAKKHKSNYNKLYCLITNDHVIPIGNDLFGDWEDNGELPEPIKHVEKNIRYD